MTEEDFEWVPVDSGGWDLMVGGELRMHVNWRADSADYATDKGQRLGRTWPDARKSAEVLAGLLA